MYKKMNRVIEKEKDESLLSKGVRLFLATDNRTLCQPYMYKVYILHNELAPHTPQLKDFITPPKQENYTFFCFGVFAFFNLIAM